jgi:F-type H+-transporting ATPase subunit delta
MAESRDINAEHARVAAQIEADVGVEHIAHVYAEALLGASEKAGQTPAVLDEFDSLVADVLDRHPKLETILGSALISHEEKLGILDRVFGPRASATMLNFLKVVSHHGRLDCLRAIHLQAHRLYDKLRGRVQVELTTATPVSEDMARRIVAGIRGAVGGEPVLTRSVAPQLIGGAVLRIGDTVHDASIANQLQKVRQQMIDRSAHEIQSRRDRFRHPAGN